MGNCHIDANSAALCLQKSSFISSKTIGFRAYQMTAVVSVTILEMVWLDSRKRYDREDWLSPDAKYLVQRKYVLQNVENMRLKTMRGGKGYGKLPQSDG